MKEISSLNKSGKHYLVRKLHSEGKNYREIAEIAHVSLRDIKPIIEKDKENPGSKIKVKGSRDKSNNHSIKILKNVEAYKLFLKGMSLVEVSIKLNLSYDKIRKYWLEYLRLKKKNKFYKIYMDHEGKIGYLIYIHDFMVRNKVDKKNILNVLSIANNITKLNQIQSYLVDRIERALELKNYYKSIENKSHLKNY
ncbi:MAG: hypothetical protein ACE5SW_13585 [Nitrososphaeraceae archaeon]